MRKSSADLVAKARTLIPDEVNSATRNIGGPFRFIAAKGSHVTDLEGRDYTDYYTAFGPILLGHSDNRVNDVVVKSFSGSDLMGLGMSKLTVMAKDRSLN